MTTQQHTIGKLLLEVQSPPGKDTFALQGILSNSCTTTLSNQLAALFDTWTSPDTLLQIPKLEIDLGVCDLDTLQRELPQLVISYLRQRYQGIRPDAVPETGMRQIPLRHAHFNGWLYFLEHGVLPFTATRHEQEEWETAVLETLAAEAAAWTRCSELLRSRPLAVKRLVYQFSHHFVHSWILAYSGSGYHQALQLTEEWETCCYETLPAYAASIGMSALIQTVLPDRSSFRLIATEWLIKEMILPGRNSLTPVVLDELIRYTIPQQYIVRWLGLLPQLPVDEISAMPSLQQLATGLLSSKYNIAWPTHSGAPRHENDIAAISDISEQKSVTETNICESASQEIKKSDEAYTGKDEKAAEQPEQTGNTDGRKAEKEGNAESILGKNVSLENSSGEVSRPQDNRNQTSAEKLSTAASTGKTSTEEIPVKQVSAEDTQTVNPEEGEQLYVGNAGLILLHPYLGMLFDALRLRREGQFCDEDAQAKAVQLLGYLANGDQDIPEYDLVLPKLLCGIMPAQPVKRFITLTAEDKTEADELLLAVIRNWGVLGNTTPDGLRANFLLREGRLEWKNEEWQLYVSQQAYDILLNRLPWGLSVISLSWMPWLIKTVWI
ncbi:MAG TPA: contractile injection system tape measure protein [Chitinophaga sp.]|uniref:contractile injection system tape measure protein n=1 Tax=Chitinophaga sp. TaxID=1869181 RepID=UPI002B61FEDF|nr:contractile injection system tape measure protein [Chitinophaga sp.]HVI44758.1 contractile injection system tape measure protein [Chitinophaga sp.]